MMLRVLAVTVFLAAVVLVACGRQVTPNPSNGANNGVLPGYLFVRYDTANPMDFTNVRYLIAFNTSGNGGVPYTNAYNTGYANYSFIITVSGVNGFVAPQVCQIIRQQGGGVTCQPEQFSPSQVILTLNSNGRNNEFTIMFDRRLFYGIPPASPTPPPPTTQPQNNWTFNFITTDTTFHPLDALGIGGPNDTSFNLPLPVNTAFDFLQQLTVPAGATRSPIPSAQLAGGEIINNP
ncbi:MAG: hypothetical protein JO135_00915 [Candidatus Eremiobacteraeota bacterium]|nr:hypothetical protein [Candidatus Eremiobacteraeota bacterium]